MRTCISCNKEKPVIEYRRTTAKECKNCMYKRKWLKRTYGITPQEYESMYADQHGKCAICECELLEGRTTHVDHDHTTGKIRGLLCRNCNFAIGLLNDSLDSLRNAIAYLAKHSV